MLAKNERKWVLTCPQCCSCTILHVSITVLWAWAALLTTSIPDDLWVFPDQDTLYRTTIAFAVFNATMQCIFYFAVLGVKCIDGGAEMCKIAAVMSGCFWMMLNVWLLLLGPFLLHEQIALGSDFVLCYCIVWFCVMAFWVMIGYVLVVVYVWPGFCIDSQKVQQDE